MPVEAEAGVVEHHAVARGPGEVEEGIDTLRRRAEHELIRADAAGEQVVAGPADERVVAGTANQGVVQGVAEDHVVAGAADHILDAEQRVGADVDALGETDGLRRRMAGGEEQCADGIRIGTDAVGAEHRLRGSIGGVEIDDDAVRRRRVDGRVGAETGVIDVVAIARTADDGVVATAGVDDVVASAGLDFVVPAPGRDVIGTAAGEDVIVAVAGDDIIVAVAGDDIVVAVAGDDIVVAVAGCDVEVRVDRKIEIDIGVVAAQIDRRRGEHDQVAGLGGGRSRLHRSCEAAIADKQVAAAAVLNDLGVQQRVGALGAAVHLPMAGDRGEG